MAFIGNFPTTTGFTAVNFRQVSVTKKTETQSGRVIRLQNSTTRWKGTLSFPSMTRAEFAPIQGFVAKCQGSLNEFDIVIPTVSSSSSAFNHTLGVVHTNSAGAAGATDIDYACGTGPTNVFKAGDLVRFHNHSKVYMVTDDSDSDASGLGVLNFQPPLVQAVPLDSAGQDITASSVPIRMILSGDIQEYGFRTDGLIDYEIDVEEVY